jgi:hypothetical protein
MKSRVPSGRASARTPQWPLSRVRSPYSDPRDRVVFESGQVSLCRSLHALLKALLNRQFRKAWIRHPIVPLLPKHYVTGVAKGRLPGFVQASANVVRMPVGENDRVNLVRLNPFGAKKRQQFPLIGLRTIHSYARIYQHPVSPGINQKIGVRKFDLLGVLSALAQPRLVVLLGEAGQKHSNRLRRSIILDGDARKASYLKAIGLELHCYSPRPCEIPIRRIRSCKRTSLRNLSSLASAARQRGNQVHRSSYAVSRHVRA